MKTAFLLLCLIVVSSCEFGQSSGGGVWSPDKENVDPVSAVLQFSDIPIPRDFKLEPQISFSYEKDKKRFGKLVYIGKMDLNELETFMVDQLEFQQWKLQSKTLRAGESALFFLKGTEELQIYIRETKSWSSRLEIILG